MLAHADVILRACAAIIARCIVLTTAEGKVDMIIVTKVGLWA